MILKIERYIDDQNFWIIDKIDKVSVSKDYTRKNINDLPLSDSVFFDLLKCNCFHVESEGENWNACSDCLDWDQYWVKRLVCRMKDGEEYTVTFDTIAYLLNDDGKTIEKIVVNYRK